MPGLIGKATNPNEAGALGESDQFEGVRGVSHAGSHGGVVGINDNDNSNKDNPAGPGVFGTSRGTGVWGNSETWLGVFGETNAPADAGAAGVLGEGKDGGDGVKGHARGQGKAGVAGIHITNQGPGIWGKGSPAGLFEGNVTVKGDVEVTGDIRLVNADCAEDFDVSSAVTVEPGTVMVLGNDGALSESQEAYDKRVAGVISGAGDYKPGIVLDKQNTQVNRAPLALLGKVYCKVDASHEPIDVGDLLTTSDRPGHAMKAADPLKAFGSIIGKALRPFKEGQGLIPILIALQ
jgi:hypothetical protein